MQCISTCDTNNKMAIARKNSTTATHENAGASATQYLFDLEPRQEPHCDGVEQSPDVPITRQRVASKSKAPTAHASGAMNLFEDGGPASGTKRLGSVVGPAEHHDSRVRGSRISVVRVRKQRVNGSQRITTAVETVCSSAYAVWTELNKHTYQHIETTPAGVQVECLLSSVGRSELIRRTGQDRKTVRLAIRELIRRHLIELHKSADPYMRKPEIYRLYDPCAAAERMRVDDGLSAWRQRGRGRVVG